MPSDPRVSQALAALALPIAEFRSLVRDALTRAEDYVTKQGAGPAERAEWTRAELGQFADRHIDAARFAVLFAPHHEMPAACVDTMRLAIDTLHGVMSRGDDLFVVEVPPGDHLDRVLVPALGEIGRAFGAVILTDLIRGGRYDPAVHDRLLASMEFATWNTGERRVAPPLVITLDGADLRAGELAAFADGREKIVLVVRGDAAPAPLVRCITPGTLVIQTEDGRGLERMAGFDGPAIAAVLPAGAATFIHDPAAGRESWQRLTIWTAGEKRKRAVGGASVWQMAEDSALLAELGRVPVAVADRQGSQSAPATEVVDRIATWLLGDSEGSAA